MGYGLTTRQKLVLDYIQAEWNAGRRVTHRKIMRHFGRRTPTFSVQICQQLIIRGYLPPRDMRLPFDPPNYYVFDNRTKTLRPLPVNPEPSPAVDRPPAAGNHSPVGPPPRSVT